MTHIQQTTLVIFKGGVYTPGASDWLSLAVFHEKCGKGGLPDSAGHTKLKRRNSSAVPSRRLGAMGESGSGALT